VSVVEFQQKTLGQVGVKPIPIKSDDVIVKVIISCNYRTCWAGILEIIYWELKEDCSKSI
jgi:hypothetical protein